MNGFSKSVRHPKSMISLYSPIEGDSRRVAFNLRYFAKSSTYWRSLCIGILTSYNISNPFLKGLGRVVLASTGEAADKRFDISVQSSNMFAEINLVDMERRNSLESRVTTSYWCQHIYFKYESSTGLAMCIPKVSNS